MRWRWGPGSRWGWLKMMRISKLARSDVRSARSCNINYNNKIGNIVGAWRRIKMLKNA